MSEGERPVDFLLQWQSTAEKRRTTHQDSVEVEVPEGEAAEAGTVEHAPSESEPEAVPEEFVETPEEPGPHVEDDEEFEWSEDRERALDAAFSQAPEGSSPRVHLQLESIIAALSEAKLAAPQALVLVGEIDAYLQKRLQAERAKVPVAHPAFLQSREDKVKALVAWQEAAAALREYLEHGEEVQLKVARYAAEQGRTFLEASLEVLLAAEPTE